MYLFKIIDFLFVIAMSLLLVYDFFPNFPFADAIPTNILVPLILVIMVLSLLFKRYRDTNKKAIFKWQLFWTIYIILLLGILTLLGGQSKAGIALDNRVLWIVGLISLSGLYAQWKKLSKSDE